MCSSYYKHVCIYVTRPAKIDQVGAFKYLRNTNLKYSMLNSSPVPDSSCVRFRGAPISKLTNIPITDILAIKSTDSDTNTDITNSMGSSLLFLQMLQI